MKLFSYILAIFTLVSSSSFAERITSLDQNQPIFSKYIKENVVPVLFGYAQALNEVSGFTPDDKDQIRLSDFIVIEPIEIASEDEHPTQGAWIIRYQYNRPDAKRRYNLYFVANKNKQPDYIPMVMGDSIASARLQQDAMMQVALAAYVKIPEDQRDDFDETFHVIDSEVTEVQEPSGCWFFKPTGCWSEQWTVYASGRKIPINIDFNPDGNGGTYFSVAVE